eukprot:190134_1
MGAGESTYDYHEALLSDKVSQSDIIENSGFSYKNEGAFPRRLKGYAGKDLYTCPVENGKELNTLWDVFCHSLTNFPDAKLYGTRKYGGKNGTERGDYVWETRSDIGKRVTEFSSGLRALEFATGDNVGIYSTNRAEWVIASNAVFSQSMRVIALYDTLGAEAVVHILGHSEMKVVCCSKDKVGKVLQAKNSKPDLPIRCIIQFDPFDLYENAVDSVSDEDKAAAKEVGIELIGMSEVCKMGTEAPQEPVPPSAQDLAFIMYTSGTTGVPKGAMLHHQGIMSCVGATLDSGTIIVTPDDVHISYLPLAHIFETVIQVAFLIGGGRVDFFNGQIKRVLDDYLTVRPTIFAGVPRVYNKIYSKVMAGVKEGSCIKGYLFNKAMSSCSDLVRVGEKSDFWDSKVWSTVRARVGFDRVKVMVTGAAPMPPYLLEFFKILTDAPVVQGYGMTESSAAMSISYPNDLTIGHNGPPLACSEIRLEDIAEMEYLTSDKYPRGEILVRGPNVFKGYFKNEEATRECVTEDGWLHTGDVGRWNPNGTLSIIDRKKNIFKLSQGEYIAAEKLENVYGKAASVNQIFVYGNSYKSFVVAVVVPDAAWTMADAKEQGKWTGDQNMLITDPAFIGCFVEYVKANVAKVTKHVHASMKEVEAELKGFEKVRDIIIEYDLDDLFQGFSVENDCQTPSFKLRRPFLVKRYIDRLKELYTKNGDAPTADEHWVTK